MNRKPITMLDLATRYGIALAEVAGRPLWRKCCCPFHDEVTPSFYVMTDTNTFRCLGCGASGDMVAFVARMDDLTFHAAHNVLLALEAAPRIVPPAAAANTTPRRVSLLHKPEGEPRRPVRRPPPAERLRGVGADLRECAGEAEVNRDELLALANRIDKIAAEVEVTD
ncbi:MAG: CHC2 zinc finger domain-containing protein [Alphaproteobacteria bacterium]